MLWIIPRSLQANVIVSVLQEQVGKRQVEAEGLGKTTDALLMGEDAYIDIEVDPCRGRQQNEKAGCD